MAFVLLHDGDLFPFDLIVYSVLAQELHDSGQIHVVVNNTTDTYLGRFPFVQHVDVIPARQLPHDTSQVHIAEDKAAVPPCHHLVYVGIVYDLNIGRSIAEYGLLPRAEPTAVPPPDHLHAAFQ